MNYWFTAIVLLFVMANNVNGKIIVLGSSDPGLCNRKNEGQALIVKDREDKRKLIVCSQSNGKYTWTATDGSTPIGEFFNPGYDCSAILNKEQEAGDGFYWIHLNDKLPKKVWCDMTTDGGGFMLIARKNTSYTLSLPSNTKPVEPLGYPHWSCALGNAPIVDFRIQMADKEDFNKVKAHWFYRLKTQRKLKQLLIMDKGCNRRAPGIGDIAFVKDLVTNEIVTRSFRCSKFGTPHHPMIPFGWNKLNWCLHNPCKKGFGFVRLHDKSFHRTDDAGAFSYSTTRNISGIDFGATVFVGCDDKCCGCYGPTGGKKDYCFTKCHAKNGGKIINDVFTWFWVRSSLPKRVWNKCIEYKVTENGLTVWYKLKGNSEIPIKGRCSNDKALFYDGMLVVPGNASVKNAPSVDGMMVYRKDNKNVYVTENNTLDQLAKEKEVVVANNDIAYLRKKVQNVSNSLLAYIHGDYRLSLSIILEGKPAYLKLLKQWLPSGSSWELCYRGYQHGWDSRIFHARCDYKGPTVTIIRVGTYIFGAYTDHYWGGCSCYRRSTRSFIFSFKNRYNVPPFKAPEYRYHGYAIYTNNGYGATFGVGGHDIHIANGGPVSTNSYSNFGHTYKPPSGYSYGSSYTKALLAGSHNFRPSEIEVFYKR